MTAEPLPLWFLPPPEGWHAEDLDRLPPEAPRHIELIDGALVVRGPQSVWHMRVVDSLCGIFASQAPAGLETAWSMTVWLGARQRPEADLLVVRETAMVAGSRTWLDPKDVLLVAEVVSPESEIRDRVRKPQLYAEAGIRYFWRVDNDGGRAVLFTYELDVTTGRYVATGVHHDVLRTSVPFPIEVNVATLHERHRPRSS